MSDNKAAQDEQPVGAGVLGRDHAEATHRHQDVVQQQAALSLERCLQFAEKRLDGCGRCVRDHSRVRRHL